MRGSVWLLLLTSVLGWLLAAAPAAAAAPLAFDAGTATAALAPPSLAENLCDADAGIEARTGSTEGLECQSGADAAREAAEQERLAEAIAAAPGAADGEAPMCDESAASVGAQPLIPEGDRGHFEALPCEALWALLAHSLLKGERLDLRALGHDSLRGESQAPPERTSKNLERPYAVQVARLALPASDEACLLGRDPQFGLVACSGHARNVYRPPRARA